MRAGLHFCRTEDLSQRDSYLQDYFDGATGVTVLVSLAALLPQPTLGVGHAVPPAAVGVGGDALGLRVVGVVGHREPPPAQAVLQLEASNIPVETVVLADVIETSVVTVRVGAGGGERVRPDRPLAGSHWLSGSVAQWLSGSVAQWLTCTLQCRAGRGSRGCTACTMKQVTY